MSTEAKLYMVSVTYEMMVLATSPKNASEFARDQGPPTGARNFRASAIPATTSSLSPRDRGAVPLVAHGVTNPEGHTMEWWTRDMEAERAREALKRQPLLPGI